MLNKKFLIPAVVAGAFAVPGAVMAQEATSPHVITGNFTLTTDYAFRGVSQTNEDAAVQGGFDYSHSSTGLYAGIWGSNVSFAPGSIELDYYGGWAKTWGDWGVNVGVLHYDYPNNSVLNTDEVYAGGTWKWFTLKYSHVISDRVFGFLDGKGSGYAELNFAYTLPQDFVIGAHYGMTMFDGEPTPGAPNSDFDYDDIKISVSKAVKGFNLGLAYVATTSLGDGYGTKPDTYDDRVIFSVGKTF
jgi:uncharacterized protein (TIGR02001 family)